MEYIGKNQRKVDNKRRVTIPPEWIDSITTTFVFVQEEYLKMYPYGLWKAIMKDKMISEEQKIVWSAKSTEAKIGPNRRILLPKHINWENIDLIGMLDYIIIRESTVGVDFFLF